MAPHDGRSSRPPRDAEPYPGVRSRQVDAHRDDDRHGADEVFYHSARSGSLAPDAVAPGAAADRSISLVLAGGLVVLAALIYTSGQPVNGLHMPGQGVTQPAPVAAVSAPPPGAAQAAAAVVPTTTRQAAPQPAAPEPPSALFETLSAGTTSPKGVNAKGVDAVKALETATPLLLDLGPTRDTAESSFWLKRYIIGTLAEDRTLRALTKLGTLYAEPSKGDPDFGKARLVWELAGAGGDPVALCFLGLLHENGLGVAASKSVALQWFERARSAGGCNGIDEAIARVKS